MPGRHEVSPQASAECAELACGAISAWHSAALRGHAHNFVNAPLQKDKGASAYAIRNLKSASNTDSLLILVSISGGGYRAAALGYAVLRPLMPRLFSGRAAPRRYSKKLGLHHWSLGRESDHPRTTC